MEKTAAIPRPAPSTAAKASYSSRKSLSLPSLLMGPVLVLLPFLTAVVCITLGRYGVSLQELFQALTALITGQKEAVNATVYTVLVNIRLPRVLLAVLCGAGLAVSGAAFQSLFSNPLATPDTLGVASGASFGAVLGLFLGQHILIVQLFSVLFGLFAVLLTSLISRQKGASSSTMIILAGIVVSSLFNALISFVKFMADTDEQLPSITYWLMGSLANSSYPSLLFCAPFIIAGILAVLALRWRLNLLCLTEDEARSQGVNIAALRGIISLSATAITASCVAMCGQVGWVGLLIPHICRMIFGSNTKKIIPASISLGAVFMLIIDTAARSASSMEIPISVLTAIIGAPFFILLLRRTGGASL